MFRFFAGIILVSLVLSCPAAFSQTLFTYGKHQVSRQDFQKAYAKNAGEVTDKEKAIREYLELYTRFKLKVQAAKDARLDTSLKQQQELSSFRAEIIESFLMDETAVHQLTTEAMRRNAKEVEVAHIFIKHVPNATSPEFSAAAKARSAQAALKSGRDFASVAKEFSEDPAVGINNGNIGYITTFVLPYEFESAIYKLQDGGFTDPIRSAAGFHIFQKKSERAARGRVTVAQILLAFPPNVDDSTRRSIKTKADSLHAAIQAGGDFGALAAQFSNDLSSNLNQGIVREFGTGEFDAAFESAAFSLGNDGDVSRPFETAFGFHILKRIARHPARIDTASKAQFEQVKQIVSTSDRMQVAAAALQAKMRRATGFQYAKIDMTALENWSSGFLQGRQNAYPAGLQSASPVILMDEHKVTMKEWEEYLQLQRVRAQQAKPAKELLESFASEKVMEHYRANLEKYHSDFAYQLHEFAEGNLLFEMMQKNVWDKASEDTAALKSFYNKNHDKYWWEASADAIIFSATDAETADRLKSKLQLNHAGWRDYLSAEEGKVFADSARFELGQIPVAGRTNFQPGLLTANVINEADSSVTFSYIIRLHNAREQRSFEEAKGYVMNDYQQHLDDIWIAELKKKYPVKINQKVLNAVIREL